MKRKVNFPSPIYEGKYGEVVPRKTRMGPRRSPRIIEKKKAVTLSLFNITIKVYFILYLFALLLFHNTAQCHTDCIPPHPSNCIFFGH